PASSFFSLPSISDDGRFVAFLTSGQLVPDDSIINSFDMYVRDLQLNTTVRVSIGNGGVEGNGVANAVDGEISGNGLFAAFTSDASNFIGPATDLNGFRDVFVRNIAGATT